MGAGRDETGLSPDRGSRQPPGQVSIALSVVYAIVWGIGGIHRTDG